MEKDIVVFDIDGTLSKVGDRVKYLNQKKPDWDAFYAHCGEDEPIPDIVELFRTLGRFYTIILCTGRRISCSAATVKWLKEQNLHYLYQALLMRHDNDYAPDTVVKPELLKNYLGEDTKRVLYIIEDRSSMVDKWRELGYTCLQVAKGDF